MMYYDICNRTLTLALLALRFEYLFGIYTSGFGLYFTCGSGEHSSAHFVKYRYYLLGSQKN